MFHVHGMGSQRRYDESSRMVDALDQYANTSVDKLGTLVGIKAAVEQTRESWSQI